MVFSTTDNWSAQAEALLDNPSKPVNRVRMQDLRDCGIDWAQFHILNPEASARLVAQKTVRPHQTCRHRLSDRRVHGLGSRSTHHGVRDREDFHIP